MAPKRTYTRLQFRKGANVVITSGHYAGLKAVVDSPVYHQKFHRGAGNLGHGYRVTLDNGDAMLVAWSQVESVDARGRTSRSKASNSQLEI